MTTKQSKGVQAPDGSLYMVPTDGTGTLVSFTTTTGSTKQSEGTIAPDGSTYVTLTDGSNTLL